MSSHLHEAFYHKKGLGSSRGVFNQFFNAPPKPFRFSEGSEHSINLNIVSTPKEVKNAIRAKEKEQLETLIRTRVKLDKLKLRIRLFLSIDKLF